MRVVHIFKDCYPPVTGGVEQHINLLCRRLARTVDVSVLVPSRSRRRIQESLDGVQIIRVPEFGRYASVPLCPSAPVELRRLHPDLVHLHFPNPMGDLTQLLGGGNIPFAITYHADIIKQKAFLPLYRPILTILFKKCSKIIFSAEENVPSSELVSANRSKCRIIPFGIDLEEFALREGESAEVEALRRELTGPIILFVGAARYYKGLDVLLRAMREVPASLILAGRGTRESGLSRAAGSLGILDRTRFLGEVSQARLRVLLHAADVFVLPSIDRCETFGIGQVEAMACSKPVVSTDLPTGVRAVNRHGVTGFLVPPGDPDALADSLRRLVNNPGLREELGRAGRRRVEAEFCADRMVSKTLEVYDEILRSPAGAMLAHSRRAQAGA